MAQREGGNLSNPVSHQGSSFAREAGDRLRAHGVLPVIAGTIAIGAVLPLLHNVYRGSWSSALVLLGVEVGVLLGMAIHRRGHPGAALGVVVVTIQATAAGLVVVGQGFHDVAMLLFPVTLVMTGLLLERTAFAGVVAGTVASVVAIGMAEIEGLMVTPQSRYTHPRNLLDAAVILVVTAVAVSFLAESVRTSLARAQASEERFRSLVDLAVDGILIGDSEGRLIGVNRRLGELTGFAAHELLGCRLRDLFPPEEMRRAPLQLERVDAGETVVQERLLNRKDGTTVPVEMSSKRMPDGRYHSFLRDVTERRRAAEERRRLQDELRHAQKMEAVGRVAGGIAHDFNNMLMVIGSSVAVALRDLEPDSRAHRCLTEVDKAALRAASLTRQLLTFSRPEPVSPRVLHLGELVANVAPMVARVAGPAVTVDVQVAPGLGLVRVDAGLLEQAVLNLAVNARDAMPGGGRLALVLSDVVLGEEAASGLGLEPGPHVALGVTDTGTGMTDEVRERLFEPFFTTKPPGKGTGLGLAMVYGAVRQSGGGIEVETRVGRGTTFRLLFPRAAPSDGGWPS